MSDLLTPLSVIVLWLDFAGLTTLIGTLAFQCLIIRPVSLSPRGFEPFERPLLRVEAGAITLVALASVLELLLRALAMSGGNLSNVAGALPSMLLETRYGTIWLVRIALIGLVALGWRFWPRTTWSTGVRLLGAVAIALTRSLSGHAADWGDVTLAVLMDWLHLLAVSVWIGGLLVIGFVLRDALTPTSNQDAALGFALIARRFSLLATVCVVGLVATGLFHPRLRLMSFSTLFRIPYGWTLLAKLSLVLLMLLLAALNRYYLLPRLGRGGDGRARLLVTTIGRLEWLLAVFVLVSSALLTQLTPARHFRRHEHPQPHAVHLPAEVQTGRALSSEPHFVASVGIDEHQYQVNKPPRAYIGNVVVPRVVHDFPTRVSEEGGEICCSKRDWRCVLQSRSYSSLAVSFRPSKPDRLPCTSWMSMRTRASSYGCPRRSLRRRATR